MAVDTRASDAIKQVKTEPIIEKTAVIAHPSPPDLLHFTPLALTHLGLSGTMWIAAGIALLGAAVGYFMAPETKGQNLEEAAALQG
ncbi:MFS transporter [Pseudarthrobacter sp. N5]|uniref:MFS transporter n=1 Tax=Pseudarthrobacter sp. N5 TaxID=3418416 RepID=UPI003CF15B36